VIRGRVRFGSEVDMAPLLAAMGAGEERFAAEFDAEVSDGVGETEETIARSLPAGVAIERIETTRQGVVVKSIIALRFDDVKKLHDLEVFYQRGQPSVRPFDGLAIIEANDSLELRGTPPKAPPGSPGNFVFELELDGLRVVESNATSSSGAKLTWVTRASDETAMLARFVR
jgi:hypothetical protein